MLRRLSFAAVLLAAVGLAVTAASAQPLRPVPVETGLSALAVAPASRSAAVLPPGFYLETVASGLDTPVGAAFAPDGRLFVLEKAGRVVVRDGAGQRVLLDLTAEVLNQGDRGLLGIALDPAFARTGFLFLSYVVSRDGADTQRTDAFSRVTRYTVGPSGAVVAGSRRVLVGETFATGIPACYYSHTIGTLGFGADGTLLVGTGDAAHYSTVDTGGLYADCFGPDRIAPAEDVGSFRSQLLTSLAGKILRLDAATGKGLPSNPFWTGNPDDTASKVWALGFRNPFRFDVDTALGSADPAAGNPGPIHLGDVGWDRYEEIQTVRRGQNYGWPCREGFLAQFGGGSYPNTTRGQAVCPGLVAADPTFAWNHQDASASTPPGRRAFAVVGGAVYRGTSYPAAYRGQFFYTDYAAGWLASATISAGGALVGDATFSSDTGPVVDLAFDPLTQDLHLVDVGSGVVSRLRYTGGGANTAPIAVASGSPATGLAPLTVRFSSAGTADPDGDNLSYAWAFGTGATATGPSPSATYTAAGQFTARLTVTDARGATATADVPITVRSSGAVPVASIEQPSISARTLSGQTLALVALATDADAGQTATLAYRWNVTLVHNTHEHPDAFAAATRTAAYTVPFHGDSGESYALLVRLTVTDATGLTTVVERTVPIGEPGSEQDVTADGTVVVSRMPTGGMGSRSLATLSDGVIPPPTTSAPTSDLAFLQFDTFSNGATVETDWLGYTFAAPKRFGRVRLHDGLHFPDGGWFETLRVEVFRDGAWEAVTGLAVAPAYLGPNGRQFEAYDLTFAPTDGTGIRIAGRPGGSARFVSVSELRVFAVGGPALGALPVGWTGADIGPVYGAGSSGATGGTFTVRGGGDVWGDEDHFHYVYRTLVGDGTVTARITGLAGAHPWAKAGVMVRAGSGGRDAHAMLIATAAQGVHLQYRRTTSGPTEWQPGPDRRVPQWLRLQRAGTTVSAFASPDGATWTFVGSSAVALGESVLVGLMSTSTDYVGRNDVATATFTDVTVARSVTAGPEADVTGQGAPISSAGSGPALAVLRDGVAPAATTVYPANPSVQTDTYTSGPRVATGFFGYTFADAQTVSRIRFTEGTHNSDGGWFEALRVAITTDGTTWTDVPNVSITPGYPGVNDGRHFDTYDLSFGATTVRGVRVQGVAGGSAQFVSASELRVFAPAGAGGLPDGWTNADIGAVGAPGTTSYSGGAFTVRGNGDLWGDADHFQFASWALSGNGSVTARLQSVDGQNPWAKAGVMIRAGSSASAPHAMLIGTPGRGVHFQTRAATGAETLWTAGDGDRRAPVWLRLARSGNALTASTSADGATWTAVGTATIPMPPGVLVGLATASTDFTGRDDLATAVFTDVSIGGPAQFGRAAAQVAQAAPAFAIESVFPNPARDAATLRVGISQPGAYRVEMLDVLGRRVFEATLREEAPVVRNLPVDLRGASAGLYVIRVFQEGGSVVTGRLTVVR